MAIGAHGIIMHAPSSGTGAAGVPVGYGTIVVPVTVHRLEAIAIRLPEP